ncbi:MAG: YpiB family protein [Carnobacterium sp.]|nr:YpiB family protein [Carnobacterium sp.]
MNIKVSLESKKEFLGWFLDSYQLKRRESMWILNYLLNHDIVLGKVHFVENVETTPRGMMMSTIETDSKPFLFYKEGIIFEDPEQAFHEIRLNWHEDIYMELIFNDPWKAYQYLGVLEDNPYHRWNDSLDVNIRTQVEQALASLTLTNQIEMMMNQIDAALENDDKEGFIQLSNHLKRIKKNESKIEKKPNH